MDPSQFTSRSQSLLRSKTEACAVHEKDVAVHRVPGGGGVGDPVLREAIRVAKDVADGAVSADVATGIYGVVLSDSGEVDEAATQALRERLVEQRMSWTPARDLGRMLEAVHAPTRPASLRFDCTRASNRWTRVPSVC